MVAGGLKLAQLKHLQVFEQSIDQTAGRNEERTPGYYLRKGELNMWTSFVTVHPAVIKTFCSRTINVSLMLGHKVKVKGSAKTPGFVVREP